MIATNAYENADPSHTKVPGW